MRSSLIKHLRTPKTPDAISALSEKTILIYGAGNYGRIICNLLLENDFPPDQIAGFIDTRARQEQYFEGRPVKHPNDSRISVSSRKDFVVVISIYCSLAEMADIERELIEFGYESIHFCYEIAICFYRANDPRTRIAGSDFFEKNMDAIINGISYWHDDRSRETYINHFKAYSSNDIHLFLSEDDNKQYFASLPISGKGFDRFVDCGAFTGDTISDLFAHCDTVDELFVFEPEPESLLKLQDFLKKNKEKAGKIVLFPCGVWDRIQQVRFAQNGTATSAISATGDACIQCVSLDSALLGVSPTFIKMDIEGAEPMAIAGAMELIKTHKPDLAICVYHALTHFWEIPDQIRQICPEYKFFLRTYGAAGFETVLYAVV